MMNEAIVKKMYAHDTPVNELLALMFENTDEDGTLYVPYHSPSPFSLTDFLLCTRMNWDVIQFSQAAEDLYGLIDALKALAPHYKALWEEGADPAALLTDPALLQVYHTYCVPLDEGDFDHDRLCDIHDRMGTLNLVQSLRDMQESGAEMDEESLAFLCENEGVSVTEEEMAYSAAYGAHLAQRAKERVGDGAMAYDHYLRAQRLWRLHGMGAPHIMIRLEVHALAVAFMIHRHGTEPMVSPLDMAWDEE